MIKLMHAAYSKDSQMSSVYGFYWWTIYIYIYPSCKMLQSISDTINQWKNYHIEESFPILALNFPSSELNQTVTSQIQLHFVCLNTFRSHKDDFLKYLSSLGASQLWLFSQVKTIGLACISTSHIDPIRKIVRLNKTTSMRPWIECWSPSYQGYITIILYIQLYFINQINYVGLSWVGMRAFSLINKGP